MISQKGFAGLKSFSVFALILAVLLELTVFNIKFYSSLTNEPFTVNAICTGSVYKESGNKYHFGEGTKSLEYVNINQHIKNVYFDAEILDNISAKDNQKIKINISATDDGNEQYFTLPERYVVRGNTQSKYIPLNLNGDSEKIKIDIVDCNNKNVELRDVVFNAKIPFQFNAVRILLLALLLITAYIIKPRNDFYKVRFNFKSKKQKGIIGVLVIVNLAVILSLGLAHPNKTVNEASHHHQYYWLADAMLDGHLYLNDEPCDTLKNLENPYDKKARDTAMAQSGDRYKWDTAYYDGKYYVYFGVVPELLFFLPTKFIGVQILNKTPVIIMSMLAVVFAYLLVRELTRRWFSNTSFLLYAMMSVLLANCTGVFLSVRIPDLYMIPIAHAFAFSIMGLYCWIKALPEDGETKLKGNFLLLGSIFIALIAGCRPQCEIIAFFALPLFWKSVFKDRELFSAKTIKKTSGFVIPFVVVAAFLMWYNYARFGSPFDFGANYNLTVMDMVSEKFNISKIPLALYTYFIQLPVVSAVFPYIKTVSIDKTFMGNYVMEGEFGGMFATNFILLGILFIYKVKNNLTKRNLYIPVIMMVAFSLLIAIVDSNTGGLVLRYMIDFKWLMFLACIIVLYAMAERYTDCQLKNMYYKFVSVGFVFSLAYTFCLLFNVNAASYKDNIPRLFYYFQHMIQFWM